MPEPAKPPLVAHLIHRLTVGGLENGLIHLINRMPAGRYRHAIVCLTVFNDFSRRIERPDVPVVALNKQGGAFDLPLYRRLSAALHQLQPAILHTRNFGALEMQVPAALARVPARIHGEHGRDVHDLHGSKMKYNLFRKALRPFVHHYTAVSRDLAEWLVSTIGIPRDCVTQIYNGVDVVRFQPRSGRDAAIFPPGFLPDDAFVIGNVGRMQTVKDQPTLVRAYLRLLETSPAARQRTRLVLVGAGPLSPACLELLRAGKAEHLAWLPGERADVPELMRAMDIFVLPSLAEGISNTVLEAMATGLPVVATHVGGTPELVDHGSTGFLVPPSDPAAMAQAILTYFDNPGAAACHGRAGRAKIEARFSWDSMVQGYMDVYDHVLHRRHWQPS